MIHITITGILTGRRALLYEFTGRQGRRKFVPTYVASLHCLPTDERFEFSVVRDSSMQVFDGLQDLCGEGSECPPSADVPYMGVVREDGPVGFRIQIFQEGCEQAETLIGRGPIVRRHIQIHVGAAASHGCIMVAGRRRWYYTEFKRRLCSMLMHTNVICVTVQPRKIC